MLESFKRELFWYRDYDQLWKYRGAEGLERIIFGAKCIAPRDEKRWNTLFEGSKSKWREQGRSFSHMSPKFARFRALQEIADFFYDEFYRPDPDHRNGYKSIYEAPPLFGDWNPNREVDLERVLKDIAGVLSAAAPYEGANGEYIANETNISQRWKPYVEAYKNARESCETEVSSIRFDRAELDDAWTKMLATGAPSAAKCVWRDASFRTPHEIAKHQMTSLKDTLFWLIIFREHGLVQQFPGVAGGHWRKVVNEDLDILIERLKK